MAQTKTAQKDIIKRLSASGEDVVQRIADLPGGAKLLEAGNALRDRLDDVTRRLRALDGLDQRVAELEKRLDELSRPKPARKTTARKSTTARKPAPRKPS